jgi:heme/copper-type cytochrome/quinol oxidase subunit 2
LNGVVLLAYQASTGTEVIVALSIFVPVIVALALTIWVLRGSKHDPDENRWRRQRLEAEELARRVDVGEE